MWKRVSKPSSWRRLSMAAWGKPNDPTIYGWLDIDVSRALAQLEALNHATDVKVTLTHLVGKALASAIASCPDANALVRRGQVHVRDTVDVFFQIAYEAGRNLSGAKIARADQKSLTEIATELSTRAEAIRSGAKHALASSDRRISGVPAPMRRLALRGVETITYDWGLDLSRWGVPHDAFGSAMVTNVGVFGLPHAFAPLVPFSRVPILLTVGVVRDAPWVEHGAVVVRPVLPVGVTLDHRLIDGYQAGKLAQRFLEVMCDPGADSAS
jgi:pyruvate dehydrogenase E2 component (dihydrolipoamide acetyltransferase)